MLKRHLLLIIMLGCTTIGLAQLVTPQIDLPDPLLMNDGKTRVTEIKDWGVRRQQIAEMIQHYGIGQKPEVESEA